MFGIQGLGLRVWGFGIGNHGSHNVSASADDDKGVKGLEFVDDDKGIEGSRFEA